MAYDVLIKAINEIDVGGIDELGELGS